MLTRFNRPFQRTKWPSRVKSNAVSLGTRSFPSSSNFNISISIEDIMMTEDAQQCQRISSSIFEFSENLSKYFELNIYLEGSLVSLTHHKHLVSISRLNKNKKQTKKKNYFLLVSSFYSVFKMYSLGEHPSIKRSIIFT